MNYARRCSSAGAAWPTGASVYFVFSQAGLGTPRVGMQTDGLIDTAALVANSDHGLLSPPLITTDLWREQLNIVPIAEPCLLQDRPDPTHRAAFDAGAEELSTQLLEREAADLRTASP